MVPAAARRLGERDALQSQRRRRTPRRTPKNAARMTELTSDGRRATASAAGVREKRARQRAPKNATMRAFVVGSALEIDQPSERYIATESFLANAIKDMGSRFGFTNLSSIMEEPTRSSGKNVRFMSPKVTSKPQNGIYVMENVRSTSSSNLFVSQSVRYGLANGGFSSQTLLTGSGLTNPNFEAWYEKDVIGLVAQLLRQKCGIQVYKRQIQLNCKGSQSIFKHLKKLKDLADNLATVGAPMSIDELISNTLLGLDSNLMNNVMRLNSLILQENSPTVDSIKVKSGNGSPSNSRSGGSLLNSLQSDSGNRGSNNRGRGGPFQSS
ncbi:hypothetical protein Scep_002058 [Stephania cephalantha]|uniref:Uncharacterized protein n=1 Tax=Stephania cephalantha TaxID=152367 RepID=A0AAP0Q3Z0_9MAGN